MAVRALLALVALTVLAWMGVLLRDYEVGHAAAKRISAARAGAPAHPQEVERLKRAELLNPQTTWREARASYYLFIGRPRRAEQVADALVRDEPANITAWSILHAATRRTNPRRSAQATAAMRRLDRLPVR